MKCKSCGGRVSAVATACGKCGSRVAKKTSLLLWAAGAAVGWYLVNLAQPVNDSAAPANVAKAASAHSGWVKAQAKDPMTDRPINFLALESKNAAVFGFPYSVEGGSHLTLWLRKYSSGEVGASFRIDKGHILCVESNCPVAVRIDDGPVTYFQAEPSDSGASDLIFLPNAGKFLSSLKNATNLRIGIQFYEVGIRTFDFDPTHYPGF